MLFFSQNFVYSKIVSAQSDGMIVEVILQLQFLSEIPCNFVNAKLGDILIYFVTFFTFFETFFAPVIDPHVIIIRHTIFGTQARTFVTVVSISIDIV